MRDSALLRGTAAINLVRRNGVNQRFRVANSDGANVVQYSDHGGTNQQWQLVRVS